MKSTLHHSKTIQSKMRLILKEIFVIARISTTHGILFMRVEYEMLSF